MTSSPDPHGQAALMFCESLALLLIEGQVIEKEQIVDAIQGVIDVKREIAGVTEDTVSSYAAIGLLRTLSRSLSAASGPGRVADVQEHL